MAAKKKTTKKKAAKKTTRTNGQKAATAGSGKSQISKAKIRGEVINPAEFRSSEATWRIFRIMSEFVEGYDFLSKLKADVTVFGSARTKPGTKYYKVAEELALKMAKEGFSIVTGGGPGIMEAANKGAYKGGGESIGLNIQLPFEQRINKWVRHGIGFHFFFTRKVMLTSPSQAFVAFPGGFGTMDEVFEVITLIQTHKMQPVPVVLVGREFWGTLAEEFIKKEMLTHHTISKDDLKIFNVVDSADEAMEILKEHVIIDKGKYEDHNG